MILQNNSFQVHITIDDTYSIDSTDNIHFDVILNPDHLSRTDRYRTADIIIKDKGNKEWRIALLGYYVNHALLEDHKLSILQDDKITRIDLRSFKILLHKPVNCFGSCLAIYPFMDGYLIHGELSILKTNKNLDIIWEFSGRDIFVTNNDKESLTIKDNIIQLYDWDNNYYELDENGKLL